MSGRNPVVVDVCLSDAPSLVTDVLRGLFGVLGELLAAVEKELGLSTVQVPK